jgi:hypothetical protein
VSALVTRYGTTLLPLFVALAGVFTTAADSTTGTLLTWSTIVQAVLLFLSTGTDYWLPLVDRRWRGAAKTGASIVFVLLSAAVTAWSVTDGHVTKANVLLLATAVFKALVTEVATWIRVDAKRVVDATATPEGQVPVITTLPTIGTDESEQSGTIPEEPRHLAES